jgi:hypothetical protein
VARTTTLGGTTSGYSPTGNKGIEMSPARKMMTESTIAKIGRSMKNFEMFMAASPQFAAASIETSDGFTGVPDW